jgi:tetratricopeptide (TPR) repeat protein
MINSRFHSHLLATTGLIGAWLLYSFAPLFVLPAFAALAAAWLLYLLFPGWLLARLIGCSTRVLAENLLIYFVLGLALVIVPAVIAIFLPANLAMVARTSWIITTLLVVAVAGREFGVLLVTQRLPLTDSNQPPFWARLRPQISLPHLCYLILTVFVVFIVGWVTWTRSIALDGSFDRHVYQGFMRHFIDAPQFFNQGIRFAKDYNLQSTREMVQPWPVVLALLVNVSHSALLDAYVTYIPALLVPLSFLALYVLGQKITYSWVGGAVACIIQAIYYLADIKNNDTNGFNFFLTLIEDKFFIRYILLLIALWLMLEFYRTGRRRWLAPLVASCLCLAFIHPMGTVQFGIASAAFGFLSLFFIKHKRQMIMIMILAGVVLMMGLVPLWERFSDQVGGLTTGRYEAKQEDFDFSGGLQVEELGGLRRRRLWIFSEDPPHYVVSLSAIQHPIMLAGLFLIVPTLLYLRRSGPRLLTAMTVAPLLMAYTPYLTPVVGQLITPWMLWRVLWVVSPALVLAFWIDKLVKYTRCQPTWGTLWQWIPLLAISTIAILLSGRVAAGIAWLDERGTRAVTADTVDLLHFLRNHVTPNSLIVAESALVNDELPGMVGHSFGTTFRWENSPFAPHLIIEKERSAFYTARLLTQGHLDFLELYRPHYTAVYIVIDKDRELLSQLRELSHMFAFIYDNNRYLVFEWQPVATNKTELTILEANSYLMAGNSQQAYDLYRQILGHSPQEPLALIGMAVLEEKGNNPIAAEKYYQAASAQLPDDLWLRLYTADQMVAADRGEQAIALYDYILSQAPVDSIMLDIIRPKVSTLLLQFQGDQDQVAKIEAIYQHMVARWPDNVRIRLLMGQIYEEQGDLGAAIEEYRQAIELNPALASGYARLGRLYTSRQDTVEALKLYQSVVRKFPDAAWPHLELGKLYLEQANSP